jgi:hypothetical protein
MDWLPEHPVRLIIQILLATTLFWFLWYVFRLACRLWREGP